MHETSDLLSTQAQRNRSGSPFVNRLLEGGATNNYANAMRRQRYGFGTSQRRIASARRNREGRLRAEDYAIRVFVAAAVLNVNNVVFMATGIRQVGTLVMLFACVAVIVRVGKAAWSKPFTLFAFSIISYLLFGNIFYDARWVQSDESFTLSFAGTLLGVWAVAGYVSRLDGGLKLDKLKAFIIIALFISVASVYLSPVLVRFWKYLPLASDERLSGFFANPNEAGFVACGALVFVLLDARRSVWLKGILAAFCLGGVVLSLSKTALVVAIIILAIVLIRSLRGLAFFVVPIVAALAVFILQDPVALLEAVANQKVIELSSNQKKRIMSLEPLLTGQLDKKATTGRTELWEFGIKRIGERFPIPYGLGSFHNMIGGVLNKTEGGGSYWLGVHNTPLMLLGEGGVIPFALFVACFIVVILRLFKLRDALLPALMLLIILADLNSNHSVLSVRYGNVFLGIMIALVSPIKQPRPQTTRLRRL